MVVHSKRDNIHGSPSVTLPPSFPVPWGGAAPTTPPPPPGGPPGGPPDSPPPDPPGGMPPDPPGGFPLPRACALKKDPIAPLVGATVPARVSAAAAVVIVLDICAKLSRLPVLK